MTALKAGRPFGRKTSAPTAERKLRTVSATARRGVLGNRKELQKAVAGVRKEVEAHATRFVRDAERKLLTQFHGATEEQVKRLERRVARLERLIRR